MTMTPATKKPSRTEQALAVRDAALVITMNETRLTAKDLKKRGWNEGLIREYLGKPDGYKQNQSNRGSQLRLYKAERVEAAESKREADAKSRRAIEEAERAIEEAEETERKIIRKAMREAGALMATQVREALGCTKTELYRWRDDSRLPPDGFTYCSRWNLDAAVWLPATVESAKQHVEEWRQQDATTKVERRKRRVAAPIAELP